MERFGLGLDELLAVMVLADFDAEVILVGSDSMTAK